MLRPFRSKLAACKAAFKIGQEISIREHIAIPANCSIPSSSPPQTSPLRQPEVNNRRSTTTNHEPGAEGEASADPDTNIVDEGLFEREADTGYSQPSRKKRRLPTSEERLVRSLISIYHDILKKSQSMSTMTLSKGIRQPTSLAVTCARAIGRTIGETTPLNAPEETESLYDHIPANYTGHVLMAHITHLIITNLHHHHIWLQLGLSCLQTAPMEAFEFACAIASVGNRFHAEDCGQAMFLADVLQRPRSLLEELANGLTLTKALQPTFYDFLKRLRNDVPLIPLFSKAIVCLTDDSDELKTPKPKKKLRTAFVFDPESSPPPVSSVRSAVSTIVSRRLKTLVRLFVDRYVRVPADEEVNDREDILANMADQLWRRSQINDEISHILPAALCLHTLLLIAPARGTHLKDDEMAMLIQRLVTLCKLCKKLLKVKAISRSNLRRRKNKQDGNYNQAHVRLILSSYRSTSLLHVVVEALRKAGIYDLACQVSRVVIAHWDQLVDAETNWSSVEPEDVVLIDDFDRLAFECEALAAAETQNRGPADWKYEDTADAWVRMSSPSHSSPATALRWKWGQIAPVGRPKIVRPTNRKAVLSRDAFDAWGDDEQSSEEEVQTIAGSDPTLPSDDVPELSKQRASRRQQRQSRRSYLESALTSSEIEQEEGALEYYSGPEDDNSDSEDDEGSADLDLESDSSHVPVTSLELDDW